MNVRLLSLAGFTVSALLLPACAKRETPVDEGIRTRTLLVGNGAEPADLDPHAITAFTDQRIQIALFEGLTSFDEKTALAVPAAAESWEVSTDGLTWTFRLRAGLVWSNGDPLTADDFVQSWRRALTPSVACPNAYLFSPVKNADAFSAGKLKDPAALGFAAPDSRTVVITLAKVTPILPLFTALPCWQPINPRVLARFAALNQRGSAWTRPGNLVGNGPFVLTEWAPNARVVVRKNPRYWDAARNQLERIVFYPTENADVEERNFRAGQVHVTYTVPPAKIASYRERTPEHLRIDPILDVRYLSFNCGKPPLDNPKVRRAFALAIDRPAIARAVFFGAYDPAFSFVPDPCGEYSSRARVAADPDTARRLLSEAGYPGGRGLPKFSLQMTNNDTMPRVGEAIQAQWKKELGIDVTLEPLEQKTKMQNQQTKNYTAMLAGWFGDFADPVSYLALFTSDSGNNVPAWSNSEYDRLIDRAAHTVDGAARMEVFQQAETLLLDAAPVAPVVFASNAFLIHSAVKGWTPAPIGLRRFQFVRLEK